MLKQDRLWCPRCDQGWVVQALVLKTNEELFVCEECEAVWFSYSDIGERGWIDFGSFMASKKLVPLWSEIKVEN